MIVHFLRSLIPAWLLTAGGFCAGIYVCLLAEGASPTWLLVAATTLIGAAFFLPLPKEAPQLPKHDFEELTFFGRKELRDRYGELGKIKGYGHAGVTTVFGFRGNDGLEFHMPWEAFGDHFPEHSDEVDRMLKARDLLKAIEQELGEP